MEASGLTQKDLAEASGVHYVTVSRVLSGKVNPSVEICIAIAQAADVELWELIAPAEVVERERKRRARQKP